MPAYLSLRDMRTLRIIKYSIDIFKNVNAIIAVVISNISIMLEEPV